MSSLKEADMQQSHQGVRYREVLLDIPNLVTFSGLLFAIASILSSTKGDITWAAIFLIWYGVCDWADGRIARALKGSGRCKSRAFGGHLDNLTDVVAAGVGSGLLAAEVIGGGFIGVACTALLVVSAALRLAYFGAFAGNDPGYFRGLPVTENVVPIALLVLVAPFLEPNLHRGLALVTVLLLCALHLSSLRIRKLGNVAFAFYCVCAVLITTLLIISDPLGGAHVK